MYFEDWTIGQKYFSEERVVGRDEMERFGAVEASGSPMHLDEEFATANTIFGGLSAHGILIVAVAYGLMGRMGLTDEGLALLETSWRFLAPVFIGDRVHVEWSVSDRQGTSSPDRGIVVRNVDVVNQSGTVVASGTIKTLWRRRPAVDNVAAR